MTSLYEEATDKIWAQAGIDVVFLTLITIYSDAYLTISDTAELFSLWNDSSNGASTSDTVISMWFVDVLLSGTAWGASEWLTTSPYGGTNIAISDDIFTYSRLDTIAHEIGHELGLDHDDDSPNYLMASGSIRNAASTLSEITPDGSYDVLTADEIATAQSSVLDVDTPEPVSMALFGSGLALLAVLRRRYA